MSEFEWSVLWNINLFLVEFNVNILDARGNFIFVDMLNNCLRQKYVCNEHVVGWYTYSSTDDSA